MIKEILNLFKPKCQHLSRESVLLAHGGFEDTEVRAVMCRDCGHSWTEMKVNKDTKKFSFFTLTSLS